MRCCEAERCATTIVKLQKLRISDADTARSVRREARSVKRVPHHQLVPIVRFSSTILMKARQALQVSVQTQRASRDQQLQLIFPVCVVQVEATCRFRSPTEKINYISLCMLCACCVHAALTCLMNPARSMSLCAAVSDASTLRSIGTNILLRESRTLKKRTQLIERRPNTEESASATQRAKRNTAQRRK